MKTALSTPPTLHNHLEAVAYFISQMDIEMVDLLLDDNRTYQDIPKERFIEKLRTAFSKFQEEGDTILIAVPGKCKGSYCSNTGKSGVAFYGNKTKNYLRLVFEIDKKKHVSDIYECFGFKTKRKLQFDVGKSIFRKDDSDDDAPF